MSPARNLTRPHGNTPWRRRAVLLVLLVIGLPGVVGCTAIDPGGPDSPNDPVTSAQATGPEPVITETTLGLVRGKLSQKARARVKTKVAKVVDAWIDAAYAGDYPRTDFSAAYPGFSPGAAKQAAQDARLMSNAEIGGRVDSVELTKRRLRVDVLAVERRAVGVTARFVLAQDVTGELERSERIAGNLYLTYRSGGWQVFAYDAKRGVR